MIARVVFRALLPSLVVLVSAPSLAQAVATGKQSSAKPAAESSVTYLECPGVARHGRLSDDSEMQWAPRSDLTLYVRITKTDSNISFAIGTQTDRQYRQLCDGMPRCFTFKDLGGQFGVLGGNETEITHSHYVGLYISKSTGQFSYSDDIMDNTGAARGTDGTYSGGKLIKKDSIKEGVCRQVSDDPMPKKAVEF